MAAVFADLDVFAVDDLGVQQFNAGATAQWAGSPASGGQFPQGSAPVGFRHMRSFYKVKTNGAPGQRIKNGSGVFSAPQPFGD
jgi:hypothetical protein